MGFIVIIDSIYFFIACSKARSILLVLASQHSWAARAADSAWFAVESALLACEDALLADDLAPSAIARISLICWVVAHPLNTASVMAMNDAFNIVFFI